MKRTTADGSSSGHHVDKNLGTGTAGTKVAASDLEDYQEEIAGVIEAAGFTLDGTDRLQLLKATIALSHGIGDPVDKGGAVTPVPYASAKCTAHPEYPEYFPACPRYDADHDITTTQVGATVVFWFRNQAASCMGASSWAVTASGTTVTFPSTPAAAALLLGIQNDAKCSNWYNTSQSLTGFGTADFTTTTTQRCITIGGTDYVIAGVNPGTYQLTTATAAASGTAVFYPYRIAGSTTSFRLHRASGDVKACAGDSDGQYIIGLRTSDRIGPHGHTVYAYGSAPYSGFGFPASTGASTSQVSGSGGAWAAKDIVTDGTNTLRTGKTNDARSLAVYTYTWLCELYAAIP